MGRYQLPVVISGMELGLKAEQPPRFHRSWDAGSTSGSTSGLPGIAPRLRLRLSQRDPRARKASGCWLSHGEGKWVLLELHRTRGKLSSWERGDEPAPSPNPNFPNRSFRGVLMSSFPFLAWSGSGTLGMCGQGVTGPAGRHPNPPALLQAPSPHSAAFPSGESIKKTVIESQFLLFLGKTP